MLTRPECGLPTREAGLVRWVGLVWWAGHSWEAGTVTITVFPREKDPAVHWAGTSSPQRIMSHDPRVLRAAFALARFQGGTDSKLHSSQPFASAPPLCSPPPRGRPRHPPIGPSRQSPSGLTHVGAESLRGVSARDALGLHLHLDIVLQAHHLGLAGVELPGGALIRGHPGFADVIVPGGQREAVQEESQQAQHGCAVRGARPRGALERRRLGQAGLEASAWTGRICQAVEAEVPGTALPGSSEELASPQRPGGNLGASVSQTADGQIKRWPITRSPPDLGIPPLPQGNLINSGRLSGCDSGWKWDREALRGELAWGRIRVPLISVLPASPGL